MLCIFFAGGACFKVRSHLISLAGPTNDQSKHYRFFKYRWRTPTARSVLGPSNIRDLPTPLIILISPVNIDVSIFLVDIQNVQLIFPDINKYGNMTLYYNMTVDKYAPRID